MPFMIQFPYNENKAEAFYLRVFASEESYNRYFLSNYLHNYVNQLQYTVLKAIILFI